MRLFCLALALLLCPSSFAAPPSSKNKISRVEFDGTVLLLAYEAENESESLAEDIPKGQELESWTKFAAIHVYKQIAEPKAFAEALAEQIKSDNPDAASKITYDETTDVAVIDFVTWAADESFVEFNIFRLEKDGHGGITAYQYAERAYKDDQSEFMKGLKKLRQRTVDEMVEHGLRQLLPRRTKLIEAETLGATRPADQQSEVEFYKQFTCSNRATW